MNLFRLWMSLDRDGLVEHIHRLWLHASELGNQLRYSLYLSVARKPRFSICWAHPLSGGKVGTVLGDRLLALGEGVDLLGTSVTAKVQNLRR